MANTPSNMIPLGTKAPDFSLLDTISGSVLTLNKLKGAKGTVIMFICNHCPFVIHINAQLVKIANSYIEKGIQKPSIIRFLIYTTKLNKLLKLTMPLVPQTCTFLTLT